MSSEVCSYCGEEGHSIQECPKWKGEIVGRGEEFKQAMLEKLPAHAKRAYSLSGGVLSEPRYNIAVDGTWIGEYKEVEGYPWLGRVFFPINWKTKREAIEEAKMLIQGRHSLPFYMGKKDMAKATVEVVECFGSYPEDRATIWQNGRETYIYKA